MTDPRAHPQHNAETAADSTFGLVRTTSPTGRPIVVQPCVDALTDRDGALVPGALGVLIDSSLGNAVVDLLPPHDRIVTSHMHIELLSHFTTALATVTGEGFTVHVDPASAFGRVEMRGPDGAFVATATGRFAVLASTSQGGGNVGAVDAPPPTIAARGPVHPLVEGAAVHDLLDTRIVAVGEGELRMAAVAGRHLANERFGLHGGIGVLIGERANELVLRSVLSDGIVMRPTELRIVFVRPVPAVGQLVECRAEVINLGRTVAVTRAELLTADGRLAVVVDGVHTRI
jgi:uncharacterized protein (TIGR00369 family)